MSDPLPPKPRGVFASLSFWLTFVACIAAPWVELSLGSFAVGTFVFWGGALLAGIGVWAGGNRELGRGLVLGSLLGALVGASVCAGFFFTADFSVL